MTWADGDIALSTTDVVSGSWAIRPSSRLQSVALTQAELDAFTGATVPAVTAPATCETELLEFIKGANRALNRNYSLVTRDEPRGRNGRPTTGLISYEFITMFL